MLVHTCVKKNQPPTGTTLKTHKLVKDWKECPELCHNRKDCHSWSWVSVEHPETALRYDCTLFSAIVSVVQNEHHVSGTRDSWNCIQTTSHNIAGVDVQGNLNIAGLLAGHDLNEFKDVLYKSRANIITGVKTLTHVTVDNDIDHAGKVNGLSNLKTDLLFLDDTKVAEGKFTFSEAEVKNLQVNGLVDGVDWSNLLAKRLLRDTEQTISATYTFGPNNCSDYGDCIQGVKGITCKTAANYAYKVIGSDRWGSLSEAECASLCYHDKDCEAYAFKHTVGHCYAQYGGCYSVLNQYESWYDWNWGTKACGTPDSCTVQNFARIHFQGAIKGNDGDEDNAELNGQKISSIRTAENAWTAVGAVKVAAQVEANVLCHHVKDLNKAYLRNLKVDFIQKLATAPIPSTLQVDFAEVMNIDTLHCDKDIYLVALFPNRVLTAKLTDSSIENINSHVISPFNQGNPIDTAFDFQVVSKEIQESNGFSFFIASAGGISSYKIDTSSSTEIQPNDFTLHFGSSPFRMSCVDQTQACFVAIQDEIGAKFRMRIIQLDPPNPVGSIDIWTGEMYNIKIESPDFDLIKIKEKLYFAISDRQNHEKLNHLSFIEVDITYPSKVGYTVNNTVPVQISEHDFLLIAPRHVPLIVASKPEEVRLLFIDFWLIIYLCTG